MHRIAIVINSRFGQTEKIALWLRQRFAPFASQVHVFKVINPNDSKKIDLDPYDMVIIGAPVYAGNFSTAITQWATTFSATIDQKVCAVFTVSGNAGDKRPEARTADDVMLRKLIEACHLKPQYVASFGGAIHYRKYNLFLRWMMKRISKKAGGSTDTSRDHELTNWSDVDDFVHAILNQDEVGHFASKVRLHLTPPAGNEVADHAPVGLR